MISPKFVSLNKEVLDSPQIDKKSMLYFLARFQISRCMAWTYVTTKTPSRIPNIQRRLNANGGRRRN